MARRKRTPEEEARRTKIRELLQASNVGSMEDIQNLFKETIAEFMEAGLDAELDEELGYSKYDYRNKKTDNSRNGHSQKTLRTSFGDVEVDIPRDRKGEFEPQLIKKHQTSISQDIEEKILSMYAKGMTTSDIETHIQDIYGVEVSDTTISRITDKILPIAKEWQQRPLESIYAVVFLDAIHYHVRSEGRIVKKAVYIAIGIDLDGHKDVLGMWVGENESAKYWATVLNGLRNRGVEDIFIACTDNLTGFTRVSPGLCKASLQCRIKAQQWRLLQMARRKRTPEEEARRTKIRELLQASNVGSMEDIQNLFKETIAEFMEAGLDAELDEELGYSKYDYRNKNTDNSRNGHSQKTLRTSFGDVEVDIPRDRKGEFEPQLIKKHQTSISQDIEEKILSMYAKGMTTSDIETHIQDIYGVEVSDTTISRITDKILPIAKEWQQRPLESIYAVVFLDAIHYHVRSEGRIVKKAVYIAIGIDLDGHKDVLGMWVGENESAKYWATVLNGLRNRGVEDIFIACTDNLTGFAAAIEAVFPKTEIQNCIIHQLRNSSKYVSYKDLKALMADLKAVYAAVDEDAALSALDTFSAKWDAKYPKISSSWRDNWANLSTYFKYPQELRKLIYTTNAIEGFNRQLRKVTKAKTIFPTDDSLFKMLYLAMMDITKKWTGRRQDWGRIYSNLAIYFEDRMPD